MTKERYLQWVEFLRVRASDEPLSIPKKRKCRVYSEDDSNNLIAGYVDGTLSPDLKKEFSQHLGRCKHCSECVLDILRDKLPLTEILNVTPKMEALIEDMLSKQEQGLLL